MYRCHFKRLACSIDQCFNLCAALLPGTLDFLLSSTPAWIWTLTLLSSSAWIRTLPFGHLHSSLPPGNELCQPSLVTIVPCVQNGWYGHHLGCDQRADELGRSDPTPHAGISMETGYEQRDLSLEAKSF